MTLREWQDQHKGVDPVKRIKVRTPDGDIGWLVNVLPHGSRWQAWIGRKDYDLKHGGSTFPVLLENPQSILGWEVVTE